MPPVAAASPRPSASGMRPALFLGAVVIIGLGVAMYVTRDTGEPDIVLDDVSRGWMADRAQRRGGAVVGGAVVGGGAPEAMPGDDAVPGAAPCPFEAPRVADAASTDGEPFPGALQRALEAEGLAHVDVFASYEGTPLPPRSRFTGELPPNRLVLVVDQWRDPSPTLGGRVAGRALAFVGGRPRCVTEVEVDGDPPAGDVDQARLDLVWSALLRGRGALRAVTPASD